MELAKQKNSTSTTFMVILHITLQEIPMRLHQPPKHEWLTSVINTIIYFTRKAKRSLACYSYPNASRQFTSRNINFLFFECTRKHLYFFFLAITVVFGLVGAPLDYSIKHQLPPTSTNIRSQPIKGIQSNGKNITQCFLSLQQFEPCLQNLNPTRPLRPHLGCNRISAWQCFIKRVGEKRDKGSYRFN